jgi:hypothetical protein
VSGELPSVVEVVLRGLLRSRRRRSPAARLGPLVRRGVRARAPETPGRESALAMTAARAGRYEHRGNRTGSRRHKRPPARRSPKRCSFVARRTAGDRRPGADRQRGVEPRPAFSQEHRREGAGDGSLGELKAQADDGRPGAWRKAASQTPTIVNVGGPLRNRPRPRRGTNGSRRCAGVLVTFARTCDGWVMPRFDSVHRGRPGVRGVGTGRGPLVTRSRVACSGVTGGRCPGLGGLGDQLAAGHLIRRGFKIVARRLRAPAPDCSIPGSSDLEAEIGCRVGLERGVRGKAHTRLDGRVAGAQRRGRCREAGRARTSDASPVQGKCTQRGGGGPTGGGERLNPRTTRFVKGDS